MRETLVFLPGMMCDERLFSPQIEALHDQFEIIVPRLDAPSIEGMAKAVVAQVDAPTFNLAGLSMGGIVAMQIIGMAPERIDRLALLDTNHLADDPARRPIRNRQIEDVEAGHLRQVIVDEMKPIYLAEQNRSNQQLLDLLIDMAMDLGPEVFVSQSIALRDRNDNEAALRAFSKPALVLCGKEDQLCAPDRHRMMADLLCNSVLEIIPGTGHISTLEAPVAVSRALKFWLSLSSERSCPQQRD